MTRTMCTLRASTARAPWLYCFLLILTLIPFGSVRADAAALTAFPNPVTTGFVAPGTTTITWDSGDLGITPELWVSVDNAQAALFLPLPQPRGNVAYSTVQAGHMYTFFLYTPHMGQLLTPGIVVTGHRPSANNGPGPQPQPQPQPQKPPPGHCANLCTDSLSPSNTYSTSRLHDEFGGFLCGGLPIFGTAGYPSPAFGEIAVGYEHFFDPGSDPFPCPESADAFFRGAVRFDLSGHTNDRFISAQLTFRVKESKRHYDGGGLNVDEPGIWSAAAGVDRATDDWLTWPSPSNHDYLNGDGTQLFVAPEHPNNPMISLDVSSIVRDWLRNATPNEGFVFYGEDEGYPRNNDTLTSVYDNFVLTLTFA